MTQLKAIRKFANYVLEEKVTFAKKRMDNGNWGMDMAPWQKTPRLVLPSTFSVNNEEDKLFRKDFIKRCPLAKGFSNVTLAILHECGHWMTRSAFDVIAWSKVMEDVDSMDDYVKSPYEMLATQWAICWLYCKENRKEAKKFEKRFFGY